MKKSNILILTALVFLALSLTAYNAALKAEFNKGEYKDPFQNYEALNLGEFNQIEVNAANLLNVQVQPGEKHEVYVLNGAKDILKIEQVGELLKVDVSAEDKLSFYGGGFHVIIKTPDVNAIRTDARYSLNGEQVVTKHFKVNTMYAAGGGNTPIRNYSSSRMVVENFDLDSLSILQDNASAVELRGNRIGMLRAVAGNSPGSGSVLQIEKGNVVQQADLDIRHRSLLILGDVAIPELSYTFSDSAQTSLSGASLAILKK